MKNFKIEINIKSIMLYEHLSGKSFYMLRAEDMMLLLYSIITVNNPEMKLTQNELDNILLSDKISRGVMRELNKELDFIKSTTSVQMEEDIDMEEMEEFAKEVTVTEIATNLIVTYGLDINYVMYEMKLWEVEYFTKAAESKIKQEMTDKRFWSYLQMLPHIDGKKIKSPEQLFKFPWELDKKAKVDVQTLADTKTDNIMNVFKNNKEE